MRATALRYTEMAGELIVLREAVSSTTELLSGCSPSGTFQVEVTNELVVEFQWREGLCSWLEEHDGPTIWLRPHDVFRWN
jgi:hypothetical protein